MARSRLFDPKNDDPFPLSRTGIDEFLRDPRTFVLKRKYGVKFPSIPPLTLAVATDYLLKNDFDRYREKQSSDHWIFKEYGLEGVPYAHSQLEEWRNNFKGIRYLDTASNMEVFGAVDDIWQDINSKELFIVDYKSTSKKGDPNIETGWGWAYKRQMEVYQWLFRKNNLPVSNKGYFLYVNGIKGDNCFYCDHEGYQNLGLMEFKTTLIQYTGNSDWVADTLLEIKDTLMRDELPPGNTNYDLNIYYCDRLKIEAEIEKKRNI